MVQGVRGQGGQMGEACLSPAPPHKGTHLVGYARCVCNGAHSWAPQFWQLRMSPRTGSIPGQGT